MQRLQLKLRGIIPPLLTPFMSDGETVDEAALARHVDWLIGKGVHGVMPCGTTGEFPLLSNLERKRIIEVVVVASAGRVPVLAQVGALSTRESIELARHAVTAGVDAVSVVTPYYFGLPEYALVTHLCSIADAVTETQVFLYTSHRIPATC